MAAVIADKQTGFILRELTFPGDIESESADKTLAPVPPDLKPFSDCPTAVHHADSTDERTKRKDYVPQQAPCSPDAIIHLHTEGGLDFLRN